jgi:hypothetical protein
MTLPYLWGLCFQQPDFVFCQKAWNCANLNYFTQLFLRTFLKIFPIKTRVEMVNFPQIVVPPCSRGLDVNKLDSIVRKLSRFWMFQWFFFSLLVIISTVKKMNSMNFLFRTMICTKFDLNWPALSGEFLKKIFSVFAIVFCYCSVSLYLKKTPKTVSWNGTKSVEG